MPPGFAAGGPTQLHPQRTSRRPVQRTSRRPSSRRRCGARRTRRRQTVQMRAPQFSWAVRTQLEQLLGGADAVDTGGYNVITTLDWRPSRLAEKYLTAAARRPEPQATAANAPHEPAQDRARDRRLGPGPPGQGHPQRRHGRAGLPPGDVLAYVGSAGYYRSDLASPKFAPQDDAASDAFASRGRRSSRSSIRRPSRTTS